MENGRAGSPVPPTKASLKAWWKGFIAAQKAKREFNSKAGYHPPESEATNGRVFGVPLRQSLRYANVPISTAAAQGGTLYIYGYVPVVVAKCGLYLKENGTEVEGTFRVNGSAKRMRELQTQFETPPKYGKNIDWKNSIYTTHDVASVFRRYLTQMPEPVIPRSFYHQFRDAYAEEPFDHTRVIKTFHGLIGALPRANQYLLLYVLDLLSVFARKSDKNLMTTTNLAVIFRPGILSHPDQELSPEQHKLSQEVLEFLINQQDLFLLDIPPPPRNDSILMPSPEGRKAGAIGLGSPLGSDEDYFMVPSESDEDLVKSPGGGGWKLVESSKAPTNSGAHRLTPSTSHPSNPDMVLNLGRDASVKRSVTVPSRKSPGIEGSTLTKRLSRRRRDKEKENSATPNPNGGGSTPPSLLAVGKGSSPAGSVSSDVKRSGSRRVGRDAMP